MTPAARIAAAIEVLDAMGGGLAAEQALSRWARGHRFAGSKDRAAIRDHVFDVLRVRRSAAHLGGGEDGRALMLGLLRQQGIDPRSLFTGEGHAPTVLNPAEIAHEPGPMPQPVSWNLPDWLCPDFQNSLGDQAEDAARVLSLRAPVTVRVNKARATRAEVQQRLQAEGIESTDNPRAETALTLTNGARSLRAHPCYQEGLVEPQDAASQAVVSDLPDAARVLDYCAGGGGKALAMAARGMSVSAHDVDPRRMRDLPTRAERAGVSIKVIESQRLDKLSPFDLVLCDAPCSGSGAWRRAPEGKWSLTPEKMAKLIDTQADILNAAAQIVGSNGWLIYATCSVLKAENEAQVDKFLDSNPDWRCSHRKRFPIDAWGDGFFTAHLTRE